ncbi:unnamed protein product [Gongylonema pulchrum]|uniref:non-specific serine/threonine protein kinase n=1 Tax=Gongylonema pulchrum TaxID=637853 RepID=A0A3P7NQ77_9BILA|nr:unnamed protein product [Gongylonema pulchrum]
MEKAERTPLGTVCANLPCTSSSPTAHRKQIDTEDPFVAYPLALKIMFNYQFAAPERHLWMDMGTELIPVRKRPPELIGYMAKYFLAFITHLRNIIACGCHAAVYEARARTVEKAERTPLGTVCANLPCTSSSPTAHRKQIDTEDPFIAYPLALKIMFNYQFAAPERHLWMDMGTELIPVRKRPPELIGYMAKYFLAFMSFLPHSHPNIVHMYKAFTDRMPILEDAHRLYPEALPTNDFFELVVDEPKTLFIVMKRYRMTLREYVLTCKRNFWIGRVMFGQLLEAIVYLYDRRISHRDIKSDNILLDFDTEEDVPHLVLSDFGCALATGTWKVRYHSDTVDLGGNLALRAPEIRCARPDPDQLVDFRMADLWAAATIGYEIFTR